MNTYNKRELQQIQPMLILKISWTLTKIILKDYTSAPYLPVFSPNAGKYGTKKLQIQTLSTQWQWVKKQTGIEKNNIKD